MFIYPWAQILKAILVAGVIISTVAPQNLRVDIGKRSEIIPKRCESVVAASLDDIPGLIREANCLGAGDMLVEYTYETKVISRSKDKNGLIKEESTTYEVYIPALKEGMRARGILLVTVRNGVPVPEKELEKERLKAGERLEKEDKKIVDKSSPEPKPDPTPVKGMMPIGMYSRMGATHSVMGIRKSGTRLSVATFLETCNLKLLRHAQSDGRDTLVFGFTPRPNISFGSDEKYVAQLVGEIWIDAADHIVTRVIGWPTGANGDSRSGDKPPAVYAEMVRLPTGVWLPRASRINGLDYPKLFDGLVGDSNMSYSEYKRFVTDVKRTK